MRHWDEASWFLLACAVLTVALAGLLLWRDVRHPCVKYDERRMIIEQVPHVYDCTPCVERKP